MTDRRISVHERVQALQALEAMAWQANQIATWLAENGIETESDMIDKAARDLLASCWMLERPLRAQVPPQRWENGPSAAQILRNDANMQVRGSAPQLPNI